MGLFLRVPSGLQPHVMGNGFSPFRCRGRGLPVASHAPSPPRPALGGYPQRSWGRGGRPRRGNPTGHPLPGPCPQGMRFLYNITPEHAHTPHIHLHGGAFLTCDQWDSTCGMRTGVSPGSGVVGVACQWQATPPRRQGQPLAGIPSAAGDEGGRPRRGISHTPPAPSPHARRACSILHNA